MAKPAVRILEVRVAPPRDALDRFEAAWNRLAEGKQVAPLRILSLQDLPSFAKALTPARWALLERLRREGPCSIYDLTKKLGRNYKNVHTDVSALVAVGLIEKDPGGRVRVPWDVVRAELRFP